jgi:sulfur-oxidizing protein SoxZ
MARALINVPAKVKRGDIVEIKALIAHPMETGYRHDIKGEPIPRDIIKSFACSYNGEDVFRAELFPAIAANPFLAFTLIARESGILTFSWTDDHGETEVRTAPISVE